MSTTIEELADAPWLLNGQATRCALATKRILDAVGIAPRIVGTIADNPTLLALVAAGQGVTMVPARVIDHDQHDVTIAEQDLGITRTIHAVTRTVATSSMSPLIDLLAQSPDIP